jgi:hypothetical protein
MRFSAVCQIAKRWLYPANSYASQPAKKSFVESKVDAYAVESGLEDQGATAIIKCVCPSWF